MASLISNYARALADAATSAKMDAVAVSAQIEGFAQLMAQVPALKTVLDNPSVPHAQKLKLLDALASRNGHARETRNFIAVLVDHRRLALLPAIAQQFKAEINARLGLALAAVTTAHPLDADERREVEEQVAKVTGMKVNATYSEDASLLGGVVVRVGSTVFDGSVRGQLERVRSQMAGS